MTPGNANAQRIAHVQKHVSIFDVLAHFGHEYPMEATQQIRCPFHEDRSPSARVYADQNKVFCFTEQRSWDVIDAAAAKLGVGLDAALDWLEQQFAVPGVTLTLQGTIRTQLAMRVQPDIQGTAQLVEDRLRRARRSLGLATYTKLLYALDLSVWEVSERQCSPTEFQTRMATLLSLAG